MRSFSAEIWQSLGLTIELASLTTLILLIVGTPLAWWLAHSKSLWTEAVATIIALPLVLLPTVRGFYLLVLLGPNGPGGLLAWLWDGHTLAFTFARLVVGSVLWALTFVVQPIRNAFGHRQPSAGSCGHSARLSIVCLLYGRPAPGATGFSHSRCAWLCAYN